MKLNSIRKKYNKAFGYNNTSDHLYRIDIDDRDEFIKKMRGSNIICGVHYSALHENKTYKKYNLSYSVNPSKSLCDKSSVIAKQTVSIPFHEELDNDGQLEYIIKQIKRYKC